MPTPGLLSSTLTVFVTLNPMLCGFYSATLMGW